MSLPQTSEPSSESPMPPLPLSSLSKGVTTVTLIVATTPVTRPHTKNPLLGIGLNGTLPWPRIKSDMAFFARVTSRPPPVSAAAAAGEDDTGSSKAKINAIIMGRKTYYSLPKSLRPLKDRLNVVISRDTTGSVAEEVALDLARQKEKARNNNNNNNNTKVQGSGQLLPEKEDIRDAFVSKSLETALDQLTQRGDVGNIFVIGGGEIYSSALNLASSSSGNNSKIILRILMTRVKKRDGSEFECDTFFPHTDEDLLSSSSSNNNDTSWREAGSEELQSWVGERVASDWVEEGDVAIKISGYKKTSSPIE